MSPWVLAGWFLLGVLTGAALVVLAAIVYTLEDPHARALRRRER